MLNYLSDWADMTGKIFFLNKATLQSVILKCHKGGMLLSMEERYQEGEM